MGASALPKFCIGYIDLLQENDFGSSAKEKKTIELRFSFKKIPGETISIMKPWIHEESGNIFLNFKTLEWNNIPPSYTISAQPLNVSINVFKNYLQASFTLHYFED